MPKTQTILFLLCIIFFANAQKQIDTFNILLPQINQQNQGIPIQLINAQGACFDWSSSASDIVSVEGMSIDNTRCLRKGLVTLKHIGPYPSSLYITASNEKTEELSNIPVRIRPINKISIVSKSRMMNRNERQDLNVYGYDKQQNRITSLEGLKFKWELIQNYEVLVKISLKDSHLILPLSQRKNIERRGFQSDILVIKGINPGKAKVKVQCIQPGYEHLYDVITISVHQRFDIIPSLPTYLLTESHYQFGLVTPAKDPIAVPKSYYKYTIDPLFQVSNNLTVRTPETQTYTTLKVQDIRTEPSYFSQVEVYSKNPTQIALDVQEYIIVGEKTKVNVKLFWNKIQLHGYTDKIEIITTLPYDKKASTIYAEQRATVTVKAVYKHLSIEKKVTAILPLKAVLPSNDLHLPIDQSFELKIVGGSGLYEYQLNKEIALISGSGIITTKKEGQVQLIVVDKKAPLNRLIINLKVSPLSILLPLESNKQLNKNQYGPIFIQGQSQIRQFFTQCNDQQIVLEMSHLSHFENNRKTDIKGSINLLKNQIKNVPIVKQALSRSQNIPQGVKEFVNRYRLYVKSGDAQYQDILQYAQNLQNYGICSVHSIRSYEIYDGPMQIYMRSNINVRNKFQLRVYSEIQNHIQSNKDDFVMTPLTSLQWKTQGGSYQWQNSNPTQTYVLNRAIKQKYPIVHCPQNPTEFEMKLTYKNPQTKFLLLPVNQSKTIHIECSYPSALRLNYEEQVLNENIIFGLKGQQIKGWVYPLNIKGQKFYNFTNLAYQTSATTGKIHMKKNHFTFTPQQGQQSKVIISNKKLLDDAKSYPKVETGFSYEQHPLFTIDREIINNHLLLLYNPKKSYTFTLSNVTNIEISCNGSVTCAFWEKQKAIKVNTSRLGTGHLLIRQRSLYGMPHRLITFDVIDADQMTISSDKNSVQLNRNINVTVHMYYQKKLIPIWQYQVKDLSLIHQSGLRSKPQATQTNLFNIYSQKSGLYHITAEQHYPKFLESSNSIPLTVYDKFEVNIPNLTEKYIDEIHYYEGEILVGINCIRQINFNGGPQKFLVQIQNQKEDILQIAPVSQSFRQFEIYGSQKGKSTVKFVVQSVTEQLTLAVLTLHIETKPIEGVEIYSLNEALINAQFRIIPHLLIDGKVILDSTCDLIYKWKSTDNLLLHNTHLSKGGINATALQQGQSLTELEVLTNSNDLLFSPSKTITIHKSVDLELPTIIGADKSKISTNLLIPPYSGYTFDQYISVTKISQCQEKLLVITSNKLHTTRQKGIVSVRLRNKKDQNYNNFLNVIVTEIKALFIQSQNSYIQIEQFEQNVPQKIRFYVQDMYGRLFYNNLFNIDYEVISSNSEIFRAEISQNRQFINIYPKKQGQANLILKLKQEEEFSSESVKLLDIPHDIVTVKIGKVMTPSSPIYIHQGGQALVSFFGVDHGDWQILSGDNLIDIDAKEKRIYGKHLGEAVMTINGYTTIVRVVKVSSAKQISENIPKPGFHKAKLVYRFFALWKGQQIPISSISNYVEGISNNLQAACQSSNQQWFNIVSKIENYNGQDLLTCTVQPGDNFPIRDAIPQTLPIVPAIKGYLINTKTLPIYNIYPTFFIHQSQKTRILSNQVQKTKITINTLKKLDIYINNGETSWYDVFYSSHENAMTIQIDLSKQNINKNTDFSYIIKSEQTGQIAEVKVKYVTDGSSVINQQDHSKETHSHSSSSSYGLELFEGWHWTDFIILIMAVNFIVIVIYQTCSNNDPKYKVL